MQIGGEAGGASSQMRLRKPCKSGPPKQVRRQLEQQADRQADDVGDASLDPRDQGRAERLDRVAAGAARATRRTRRSAPSRPRSSSRKSTVVRSSPVRSSPSASTTSPLRTSWARPDSDRDSARASSASAGLAERLAVEDDVGIAGDDDARRRATARPCAARSRRPPRRGPRRSAPRPRERRPRTRRRASRGSPAAAASRMRALTLIRADQSSGNQIPISRSADSSESEPWTMLKVTSSAKSPADRAGGGLDRVGRADQLARRGDRFGPLEHHRDQRPAGDEGDELAEERLLGVLGVVLVGDLLVGLHQLQRLDPQALALEAGDHLAGQGALEGVRLDEDQGPAHVLGSFAVVRFGLAAPWPAPACAARPCGGGLSRGAFFRRVLGSLAALWSRERCGLRRVSPAGARGSAMARLAVGAERPARVDRLAAAGARVLEPALALGAAQVVRSIGNSQFGQELSSSWRTRSSAALISSSRSCASSRNSGGRRIA